MSDAVRWGLLSTARKISSPGPGFQRPDCAVFRPSGTAQYDTNPRKWSMRVMSTRSNVRRNRSVHQR